MLGLTDIIIFGIGAVVLSFWLILFAVGLKYASVFDNLNENDYPLNQVYFVGYALLEIVNYQYHSKKDRRLRKELEVLYDPMYTDFYLRVARSEQITISLTLGIAAFILYGMSGDLAIFCVIVILSIVLFAVFDSIIDQRISSRADEMLGDFTEMISKLALLTNTGMIMREAWENVANTSDAALYTEMKKTVQEMNNGIADVDAYFNFGSRCMLPEIKKFTSTIVQGLLKGNSELASMLQVQSKEVWAAKKQRARREGEKAASKLLIPTFIMFGGIMVMMIVPIFSNLGI